MFKFYLSLALVSWTLSGVLFMSKKYLIPSEFKDRMDDIITLVSVIGGFSTVMSLLCI